MTVAGKVVSGGAVTEPVCVIPTGQQHPTESRIPRPGAEDELPSKSTICRTMTVQKRSPAVQVEIESEFNHQRNQLERSRVVQGAFKISTSFEKMFSGSNPSSYLGRLLRDSVSLCAGTGRRRSCSQQCTTTTSPPIRPTSHWPVGMITVVVIILATLPSSSVVMCVPLGGQSGNGGAGEGEAVSYSVQPKGQLFLPSLFNSQGEDYINSGGGGGGQEYQGEDARVSNHLHRFVPSPGEYPFQQRGVFHKDQLPKDSLMSGDDDDNSTGGGDDGDGQEWETVLDPHLYVLTEWGSPPYQERFPLLQQQRKRRNSGNGPSLSIVNPLDVLRQRLLLEIARRRMRQSHNQIIANEEILRKIGRRR